MANRRILPELTNLTAEPSTTCTLLILTSDIQRLEIKFLNTQHQRVIIST